MYLKKVKITVFKTFSPKDVFGYDKKNLQGEIIPSCRIHSEGEEFICENLVKPEGFCDWAWRDLYKDIAIFAFDGDFPWLGGEPKYTSCSDGGRPVVFALEKID